MLKKVLIGLAALVLLLVVGAVALLTLVDVDHFKPRIEQQVHDKLDRTLKFDGRLSLSVFPTIAVALPHTTLSERGSDTPFISLDRARVSLAVLPLLSGRIEAGTAALYGLRASVVRHADGTTSVDDLTGGPQPASQAAKAPEPAAGGAAAPLPFELGGIELIDAQVSYRDERAHNTVTLSKLNLKTGRIATRATTPVDLSVSVAATEPPTAVDLSLKATADIDAAARSFGARGLEAHALGHAGANQFDVALTAPKIALDPEHVAAELVKLVATVSGSQQARVEMSLETVSGTGEKISVGKMTLDLKAQQSPQKVSAHLVSPLRIGVTAQKVELTQLNGEVDLDSPALPQKSLKVNLDGSLAVDSHAQEIAVRLRAHFDDTSASTRLDVHGFAQPRIGLDAELDRLNLDRYLPASASPSEARSAKEGPPPVAPPGAKAGPPADQKIDLSALKPLNLAGEVRIGSLQAHNLKVANVKVGLRADGGRLEVSPLSAALYQGTLTGTAKLDADGNRIAVNAVLDGVSIEPLLKDLIDKDLLEGHGGVKLNVTTAGPTAGAMRRGLAGSASLALRDGAVHGINIAQKLRDLKSVLSSGAPPTQAANMADKTDFSELSASFSIRNGVATNNDLQAKSPLLRVTGAGSVDIGAGSLDYTVRAAVVGTLAGQGGADLSNLNGVTVPVRLYGPFTAVSYQLDWSSIAAQAAKTQAADKLKGVLADKLKQTGQAPGQNLGDTLKKLLGK